MAEVSCEDILSLVHLKVLEKIPGTPMFANMIKLRKQLGTNLIGVNFPWGRGKVQMGLLKYPTTFAARNGGPYDPLMQQLPTYPIVNTGTSTSNRERLCAETTEY